MQNFPDQTTSQLFLSELLVQKGQSLNPFEIFQATKKYLSQKGQENQMGEISNLEKCRSLKRILERRLCQKFSQKNSNFITLLCIYIYISNSSNEGISSLYERPEFARNIHKIMIDSYIALKQTQGEQSKLVTFSTVMFILVALIQKIELNHISKDQIFTDKLATTFLSIQFPDDQKLIKSYEIIMLYLMRVKSNSKKQMTKMLFKSVKNHIGLDNLQDGTFFIFLNFMKRNMKYFQEKQKTENKIKFLEKLKIKMVALNEFGKLLSILEVMTHYHEIQLTVDEFILIYIKFLENKRLLQQNEPLFKKIVRKITPLLNEMNSDKLMVLIFQKNYLPTLTLQTVKKILPSISFQLLLHFCETNRLLESLKGVIREEKDDDCKVKLSLEILFGIIKRMEVENSYIYLSIGRQIRQFLQEGVALQNSIKSSPIFNELNLTLKQTENINCDLF